MHSKLASIAVVILATFAVAGCRSARQAPFVTRTQAVPNAAATSEGALSEGHAHVEKSLEKSLTEVTLLEVQSDVSKTVGVEPPVVVEPVSFAESASIDGATEVQQPLENDTLVSPAETAIELLSPGPSQPLEPPPTLDQVVQSVRLHFPLIQQAAAGRVIASGEALEASGAFDRKLDVFSESQPLSFYENYRHSAGVKRDTMWGGQTFAGYRIGRGDFEPWYLERETNRGGEFKAGFVAPVIRDRNIDANRSQLWQAQLEQQRIEPVVRAEVIRSVRNGSITYWDWVAAAAIRDATKDLLDLADERLRIISRRVVKGDKARIDQVDTRRAVVSRQAKLVDARRKLQQTAYKLSLFLRNEIGEPLVIDESLATGEFPTPTIGVLREDDVIAAIANRPELVEYQVMQRQLAVALSQARNETLPDVDAGVLVAQDVGEPTSSKRDKSPLELEALVTLSVPLERRKALGKARQIRGKLAQVRAKQQFAEEKIAAEVQMARAALLAAIERVKQTKQGMELAREMLEAEQRKQEIGDVPLLNLNIREGQAADAAIEYILAQREYWIAEADYRAAMGVDQIIVQE